MFRFLLELRGAIGGLLWVANINDNTHTIGM